MENRNPGQGPDTSPSTTHTENRKVAALVEIGILCRGEDVPAHGDGSADPGPHEYSGHNQLCRFESNHYHYPFEDPSVAAFHHFSPGMTMDEALTKTRLLVMIGASDSPEFRRAMQEPDTLVFLFEPDDRVLIEFLESTPLARLNREGFFIFTGAPYSFNPALQEMLPANLFRKGTPAVFMTERIREHYGPWAKEITEYLEILHYRHAIYPLTGQFLSRSVPFRNIKRTIIYDQQVHAYDNVGDFLRFPEIDRLKNTMRGHSAILVAAGPTLEGKLDYIRENRHRAVIIAVNNALKPLVEAGIKPHMVVINDVSIIAAKVFQHIPAVPETILVGQCLSDLGGDKFRQKYIFGSHSPEVFGHRGDLKLHGSVISTAFSLALHLGCVRTVLIGAQLCSDNPWSLAYAKGTVKYQEGESEKPLIHRHPQLCPVNTPFGETLYTTPNFRDAALWLAEHIRLSGVRCYNTARQSILFSSGIEYDPAPALPEADVTKLFAHLFKPDPVVVDYAQVMEYLRYETGRWQNMAKVSAEMLKESGPLMVAKGLAILGQADKNNITYLVERFEDFDNCHFAVLLNSGDRQEEALRYYYEYVLAMSRDLLRRLSRAEADCRRIAAQAGVTV